MPPSASDSDVLPPLPKRVVVSVNLLPVCKELTDENTKLRSQLQVAWKEKANLARHNTQLEGEVRSKKRSSDRSEFLAGQAQQWHDQAESLKKWEARAKGEVAFRRTVEKKLEQRASGHADEAAARKKLSDELE
eukprot:4547946-Pleurochrysis_carterae.AAC.1